MTTPKVTNFKKVQNLCTGKLSDPLWMIAALVGWTVVVVFLWLLLRKEARAFCPPGKHSSLKSRKKRNHLGNPNLPDQKSGGIEEEVTFMNLTEIRSQMSEQEDGYAALNIQRNMSPNDATYSSLLPSAQGNSIKRSTEENHLQENTRK
ncbi:uncharacterized protein [Montipora foliosa]|uniref:uncharacterized protein n=1 Tax=Montipora foliosa TaxID=591990 RepID=UPI0035F1EACD